MSRPSHHRGSHEILEERAYIEAVLLMIHADGVVEGDEVAQLEDKLNSQPKLSELSDSEMTHLIHSSVVAIEQEGADDRIAAIAAILTTPEQRLEAINVALSICMSDCAVNPKELAVLKKMQAAFELSDDQLAPLIEKYK